MTLWNTLIVNNEAGTSSGGGGYFNNCSLNINHCTVANNTNFGLRINTGNSGFVRNSIVADSIFMFVGQSVETSYSLVSNTSSVFTGPGLIHVAPKFVSQALLDFRLHPDSPAVDAANGDTGKTLDFFGQSRWDNPNVVDSGAGTPTSADMGYHEAHDEDDDGMTDSWEVDVFGDLSHDGTGDADTDGLSDKEEFDATTDPFNADTDGDGLLDGDEQFGDGSHGDTDGHVTDPHDSDTNTTS